MTKTASRDGSQKNVTEVGELGHYIDLANALPVGFAPPWPSVTEWEPQEQQAETEAWIALVKELKKEPENRGLDDARILIAAERAYAVRETLRGIARASLTLADGGVTQVPIARPWDTDLDVLQLDATGRVVLSESGFYKQFLVALEGKQASRIRICQVCGRLFWAKRRHKGSCSPPCHVKLWRKLHPEAYKDYYANYDARRSKSEGKGKKERDEHERQRLRALSASDAHKRKPRLPGPTHSSARQQPR